MVDALGERGEKRGELPGGQTDPVPHALDQHQSAAGPEQAEPVAQDGGRIGEQPHHVPGQDHVEPLLADRRRGSVPDKHLRPRTGQLGARLLDHAGRAVHGGDPVALPGDEQRQTSGAAAQVEHLGTLPGQPGLQALRPGVPDHGVEQAVIRLVVEGTGG